MMKRSVDTSNFIFSRYDNQDKPEHNNLKESSAKFIEKERERYVNSSQEFNQENQQHLSSSLNEILNLVNEQNQETLNTINNDLTEVKVALDKDLLELLNQKKMHNDLRGAVRKQNYGISDPTRLR